MSEERSEEQGAGVFGSLPASRPGTRSPLRRSAPAADAPGLTEADPPREPDAAGAEGRDSDPAAPRAAGGGRLEEEQARDDSGGLEDLAWAGVAVAAEAATLGVRLVTRAAEALRAAPRR